MLRAATYARVSTDMQAEEGKSISAQQAEMREFAEARNWEIVANFVDPGFTGTNLDRPALDALRAAAEEGAFDVLLVHELSRLSRRIFDTFRLFEELGQHDVGFASVKEPNFDFSSPTGRLFLTILAALNQYYVDLLKMHTAKSKRDRARRGLYNASVLPLGYKHSGDADTPPVVIEEEAEIVRELFEQYSTGQFSYSGVAEWLTDAGYKTRSGRNFSKDTVADILRNPFYKGIVRYRPDSRDQDEGEYYPGKHEPIVSTKLWDRCRRIRRQRRGAPRTYQPKYRVYLLNGIVSCDACGRDLRAQGAKSRSYYRDVSRQRGFYDCPDAGRGQRVEIVDHQIGEIFRRLHLPPDWQRQLEDLIDEDYDDRQTLESRRSRLIAERKRLKRMRIKGEFDDEDQDIYVEEKARIERELAELPTPADLDTIEYAAATIKELAEVWDDAEKEERRDLLRIALRDIKVDMSQGRVTTIEPYPIFVPLFRQIPLLREVDFGIFVPLWSTELAEEMEWLTVLEPMTLEELPKSAPDWPLVLTLPKSITGIRITPAVSDWLKAQRQAGKPLDHIIDLARPGVPRLKIDPRKWGEVTAKRVGNPDELGEASAAFLWTPFGLQRSEVRPALVERIRDVMMPGGTWAFVDVVPPSMPGHWLYRFFPAAWDNERQHTWGASMIYNSLAEVGFDVELDRLTYHQPISLEAAREIARNRERCPQLANLPDAIYETGLDMLEERAEREGADTLIGSEFCLAVVTATAE